jgi:L-ascorbate metabolism protein UlaG (beta-lactamase superfamily)
MGPRLQAPIVRIVAGQAHQSKGVMSNHHRAERSTVDATRRRLLGAAAGSVAMSSAAGANDGVHVGGVASLELQLIRNATMRVRLGERSLLIDPYLAAIGEGFSYAGVRRSPLVDLPAPVSEILGGLDGIFISHLHSDHFDAAARRVIAPSTALLCPAALQPRLRAFGYANVTGISNRLDWFGAELIVTPGRHGPDDVLEDMGAVNGLVIRRDGAPTLYWVGDSIWCDEVRATIDEHQPEVIVVHACGALWKGRGPLVMDQQHVEALMRHASRSTVVATHMDCVDHATVSRADLRRHFGSMPLLRDRLRVPADGQALSFTA